MRIEELLSGIKKVERIASATRWRRFQQSPLKYALAIFFRDCVYGVTHKEREVSCKTFFGSEMQLLLPSSTDIFLTGGKSHPSEIRLAKFFIHSLKQNDVFVDAGAHYGYFSMLASQLVGGRGKVLAFEPSPNAFRILEKNAMRTSNIRAYNAAVSDSDSDLTFYEFPNLYAENSTLHIEPFLDEEWFGRYKPQEIKVKSIKLDSFLERGSWYPNFIKVDVEGAEYKVVAGAIDHLKNGSPVLILEFHSHPGKNKEHLRAEDLLRRIGYKPFMINERGGLQALEDVPRFLKNSGLESDNIVFAKAGSSPVLPEDP